MYTIFPLVACVLIPGADLGFSEGGGGRGAGANFL